ncbi:helix-turn-helix transcriptional regulator [Adlercreutzia aquisgranensis]|uniref:helix-turn-helix transcriptional regulator n=1 Tax=Adlercreutzia aquisgranensis TaxID=2941323 RepID=UPI0020411817|nr:helix-turn-helix transcriptional regulator [Adlercreutzia aquisgranensis]
MTPNWLRNARTIVLGLGFALSYVWSFTIDSTARMAGNPALADAGVLSRVISLAVAVCFALLYKQLRKPAGFSVASVFVVLCGFAYTLFAFDPAGWGLGETGAWLGAGLRSVTKTGIVILWAVYFGKLPLLQAVLAISFSFAATSVLDVAVASTPDQAHFGIALLLPLASIVLLHVSDERLVGPQGLFSFAQPASTPLKQGLSRASAPSPQAAARAALFPWQSFALVAAYAFAFGATRAGSTLWLNVISFGIAGVIVLAATVAASSRMSVHSIIGVSLPVTLLGLVLAAFVGAPSSVLAQVCVNTGTALVIILALIVTSDRSYRFGLSPVFLFSLFSAAMCVCTLLGMLLVDHLLGAPGDPMARIAFYGTVFALMVLATALWLRHPATDDVRPLSAAHNGRGEDPHGEDEEPLRGARLDRDIASYRTLVAARCAQISEEGRLSAREQEVLLCMARGMSIPRIEEELVISTNTVKTHVNHIYRKLGIHSRDELRVLLNVE